MIFSKKKKYSSILYALIFILIPFAGSAVDGSDISNIESPTIGITAGHSVLRGYYDAYLDNGNFFALNASFPFSFLKSTVSADIEFFYEKLLFSENRDYSLTFYSFRAGPLFTYPLNQNAYPFFALYFQESAIYFATVGSGIRGHSYKPGYALKAGVIFPLYRGIGLKIAAEYSSMSISERTFRQAVYTGSIVFNFTGFAVRKIMPGRDVDGMAKEIESLLSQGRKNFNENEILEAKSIFLKIVKLDSGNMDGKNYLARIAVFENKLNAAHGLIESRKLYEAIPVLVELKPYLKKAGEDLLYVRGLLSPEIPELEKTGITAYETKNYDLSIYYMERLLLIDPDNNAAKIYLPRSRNRKEALDKLK